MLPLWTQPSKRSSRRAEERGGLRTRLSRSAIRPPRRGADRPGAPRTRLRVPPPSHTPRTQTKGLVWFFPSEIIMRSDTPRLLASDSEKLREQKPLGARAKSSPRKQLFQSPGCCHVKQGFSQSFVFFVEITICLQTTVSR